MRRAAWLAVWLAALVVLPAPATAQRVALVVGNGAYTDAPALPNPPNDARGVAYFNKGDYDWAIADYDAAVRLRPDLAEAWMNRGRAYRQKGANDRAVADYYGAFPPMSDFAEAWMNRGNAYYAKGQYDRALAAYNEAIRRRPGYANAWASRGIAYNAKGEYDQAIADSNEALRLSPNNASALHNRGQAYELKGDLAQAERDYRQALSANPNHEASRRDLISLTERMAAQRSTSPPAGRAQAPTSPPQAQPQPTREPPASPQPSRAVEQAQRHLSALGFDPGPADGVAGRRTRSAVTEFQKVIGVGQTGEVTEDLIARLDTAVKVAATRPREPAVAVAPPAPAAPQVAAAVAPPPQAVAPAPPPQPVVAAYPKRRVALVVGNGAYTNAPALANPANDARALAAALRRLGFEVTEGVDLNRSRMEDIVLEFGRTAETADQALVFYAGHGIQVDGRNYLLPVDVTLEDERDLRRYPTADQVVVDASGAKQFALVILDACRDNPFTRSLARRMGQRAFTVGRGLAAPDVTPPNTLIAYATAAGSVAADGDEGNSPFTTALLEYVEQPGLEIGLLFRKVRDRVFQATRGKQVPFTYGSLGGEEIYLAGRGE